ncbi:MAG: hypothetical protein SP1CHLAM54_03180 [Chlamydiia bacterium]|nr:hypothetical protein [Chlamydiia bacterium]MCH9615234.1 hypothetical protein [Chlamydiia bacterium]MCH9628444.1 hypothetical protein [Chlamydiia bacterium]
MAFADAGPKLSNVKSFTGKVNGKSVRLRAGADVESNIIRELKKDELVVVAGEQSDFFAILPPTDIKAYIFRSFVLDGQVEGERVNVRLAPDREAPIIGHLSTGDHVEGKVCEHNSKWLEIKAPDSTRFYIAKEFIEYAGNPEMKAMHDKRLSTVKQMMESTSLLAGAEMRKPYADINMAQLTRSYQTIIDDYADFPEYTKRAKQALTELSENYLTKKIAFLENKASNLAKSRERGEEYVHHETTELTLPSGSDRMRMWEPVEEALYLTWSAMHHAKTIDDFYSDQKLKSQTITGILEAYGEPVKQKPGDYILKDKDVPIAYIYSTHVELADLVGKQVTLLVSERSNNNFAFPAYYALGTE